jgi:hypothetical protein
MFDASTSISGVAFTAQSASKIGIRGTTTTNINNSGSNTWTSAYFIFNGSSAQTITSALPVNNIAQLTIDNTAGVTLGTDVNVTTLNLTNGNLNVGPITSPTVNRTLTISGAFPTGDINKIKTTSFSNLVFNCISGSNLALPAFTQFEQFDFGWSYWFSFLCFCF